MATLNLENDFLEFSKLFNQHNVRYMLIGGYAVSYHGYTRATGDIDFWIASPPENETNALKAIREFVYSAAPDDLFAQEDVVVRFGTPPDRLEILKKISGLDFEAAWPNRIIWKVGEWEIPIISLQDLRQNKEASGRPKALIDLDHLPPA